jgi:RNA polymerase sigma factor (TIGR02999 family)
MAWFSFSLVGRIRTTTYPYEFRGQKVSWRRPPRVIENRIPRAGGARGGSKHACGRRTFGLMLATSKDIVYSWSVSDITRILSSIENGDPKAADELLPQVYQELRKLAAHKMASHAPGHTLQPTALVHEAWLRLVGNGSARFAGRAHFFAAAAEAMRHILIDSARRKRAVRHGGGQVRVDIQDVEIAGLADDDELLAIHDVLDKLAAEDPQKAAVTKLRYFVGMTFEEAAEVLGISVATAKRHWAYARAWLYEEIRAGKLK